MTNSSDMNKEEAHTNDLGMIICKHCGNVIATLPTDGVTKFYGVCSDKDCVKATTA